MPTTPQDNTDDAQWEASAALQPVLDDLPDEATESYSMLANLTTLQQKILIALADNVFSEDIRTDTQIARDVDCSVDYIWYLRRSPKFTAAMGTVIREIARGTGDKAFAQLIKHAQKDTRATEIWLRIADLYQPTQRNVNVNANLQVNSDSPGSPQQAIQSTLQLFMGIGYDLQSFVVLATEEWTRLKAEGL